MADAVYEAYNDLDITFTHINSFIEGAWQITEHGDDENAVIDLLAMAQEKAKEGRQLLKEMYKAHCESVPNKPSA